jgi:ERCC4-related helicase
MTLSPYHAKYFAYELSKRCASDSVQKLAATLVDAQVDLNPHQVEAALFAFRSPLSKGAILADEVGLGKTIEAGLVISQKWAERKRNILIITPANLRKQWSQELHDKFFLPSTILEAKSFNDIIKMGNLNPFNQSNIVLCSYQFAKSKEAYLRQTKWDLVVIDEAHRLRNVYKTNNKTARVIKDALKDVPKILLTATPLQNSLLELYGLVSIVDEYAFGDLKSFRAQYSRVNSSADPAQFLELKERLKPICIRTLRRQVLEYIRYTNRIALVQEFYPTDDEQLLYDRVSDYLQTPDLYALPAGQRQLMTLILRRLLASSTFAISGTLAGLARKLESIVAGHFSDQDNGHLTDLAENYETYDELADEYDEDDEDEKKTYTAADIELMKREIQLLKEFASLAHSIHQNSKGEQLATALKRGFSELDRLGASNKAIIFTESKRTQEYIKSLLESHGYHKKIVLFNGTNTDASSQQIYKAWVARYKNTDKVTSSRSADMRAALVDYFRDEATIMIATEAAAEGINLQFCSLVINYDLPWNPQRIEQRIGRCHRYGQKFDVVVVNFLNKANAADQRVYELLNEKFQLFNGVFGASDEVLGSIESGVDFEKRIALIYQECRTTDQITSAFNDLQADMESSISGALEQTRQQLLENFDDEVNQKFKLNLKESQACLSKYEDWLWLMTKYQLSQQADFANTEHTFQLNQNPYPLHEIPLGTYKIGKHVEDAHVYRMGHPLASNIIDACKSKQLDVGEMVFDYTGSTQKISILESLVGHSGWLLALNVTINSFEAEDHVLFALINERHEVLDPELGSRLFSLSLSDSKPSIIGTLYPTIHDKLVGIITEQRSALVSSVSERNSVFFDQEMNKLDHWGDDQRSSLKLNVKELDDTINEFKKRIKAAANLPDRLSLEKQRKRCEAERDQAWRDYDQAAKEIDVAKDKLIDRIESQLNQSVEEHELFAIHWQVI